MHIEPKRNISVRYVKIKWPDELPITAVQRNPGTTHVNLLHFHNELEIGICHEGSGLYFIYDEVIPFQSGDIIVAYPEQPHVVVSSIGDPSYWEFIFVDSDRLYNNMGITDYKPIYDMLHAKKSAPNFFKKGTDHELNELIKSILGELKNNLPDYQLTIKALLWAFLLKTSRFASLPYRDNESFGKHADKFGLISPAINHITNNYSQDISIEVLARTCILSRTHFERTFKKVMKQSPIAYLQQVRLRMATILLKSTDMPVMSIALEVGYKSLTTFNRNFLEFQKTSPRAYRNRFR